MEDWWAGAVPLRDFSVVEFSDFCDMVGIASVPVFELVIFRFSKVFLGRPVNVGVMVVSSVV